MVELIEQQSGQRPEAILADNGYCSEENLEYLESAGKPERQIEGYHRDGQAKARRTSPARQARTVAARRDAGGSDEAEVADQRWVKPSTPRANAWWNRCSGRSSRRADFVNSCYAGKQKVKGEWALLCLTHNILRLYAAAQA